MFIRAHAPPPRGRVCERCERSRKRSNWRRARAGWLCFMILTVPSDVTARVGAFPSWLRRVECAKVVAAFASGGEKKPARVCGKAAHSFRALPRAASRIHRRPPCHIYVYGRRRSECIACPTLAARRRTRRVPSQSRLTTSDASTQRKGNVAVLRKGVIYAETLATVAYECSIVANRRAHAFFEASLQFVLLTRCSTAVSPRR
jgi:hypothetical protein